MLEEALPEVAVAQRCPRCGASLEVAAALSDCPFCEAKWAPSEQAREVVAGAAKSQAGVARQNAAAGVGALTLTGTQPWMLIFQALLALPMLPGLTLWMQLLGPLKGCFQNNRSTLVQWAASQ